VTHVLEGAPDEARRRQAFSRLQAEVSALFGPDARHLWFRTLEGPNHAAIIAEAASIGADLILLGDGRKPGWRERFVGTTTEGGVGLSGLPVLVVRRKGGPSQRLLSAFDGSPAACRALGMARAIGGWMVTTAADAIALARFDRSQ